MIFGHKQVFAFDIEPYEPSWERRSVSDRGPWAALKIWSRYQNITEFKQHEEKPGIFVLPLLSIASFFVKNAVAILYEEFPTAFGSDLILYKGLKKWYQTASPPGVEQEAFEDMRYDWHVRHFWLASLEGSLLPDLGFARIDNDLYVSWETPKFAGGRGLQFIASSGMHRHPWHLVWKAIGDFVAYVAEELRRRNITEVSWAHQERPLEEASRATAQEFIRLVAPPAKSILDQLHIAPEANPDAHPSLQALRDLYIRNNENQEIATLLKPLESASEQNPSPLLQELRSGLMREADSRSPEDAGYSAAQALRDQMKLDGQPLESSRLNDFLQSVASVEEIPAESMRNNFALGFRANQPAKVVFLLYSRTQREYARRMETARALGHLLLDGETPLGVLGAGSSQRARGPRRRRSGAFAAELLMPEHGVRAFLGNESPSQPEVFVKLLNHFNVSASAAAHHLWNKNMLQTKDERDSLIEEFAWKDHPLPASVAPRLA
jgi:hypothetical protein